MREATGGRREQGGLGSLSVAAEDIVEADEELGDPDVSVVLPCLNEANSIEYCIRRAKQGLSAAGVSGEVVVADNGSSDGSIEIASALGARVVHVPTPGYGSAVRGGIEAARAKVIVIGDADGQHDFGEIPRFLASLAEGHDLVVGNRFGAPIDRQAMSWTHRYIGNPLLSGLLRFLLHPGIHDAQCGMRALTKDAYLQMDLRTTGFELCPEMVVKATRQHLRVAEIPIRVAPELRDRPPHLRTVPDGWRHLTFLLMCSPNWLFIGPGAVLFAAGIAIVSWLFVGSQHLGGISLDTRAQLFGVLLSSVGLDIASIGLFARVFAYSEPRRSHARSLARAFKAVTLEQGLALGALLIAAGLVGDGVEYFRWASQGFGILKHDRAIIFWSMWFVLGIQICFSSFFLSMIGVSRGTWIGDRS